MGGTIETEHVTEILYTVYGIVNIYILIGMSYHEN